MKLPVCFYFMCSPSHVCYFMRCPDMLLILSVCLSYFLFYEFVIYLSILWACNIASHASYFMRCPIMFPHLWSWQFMFPIFWGVQLCFLFNFIKKRRNYGVNDWTNCDCIKNCIIKNNSATSGISSKRYYVENEDSTERQTKGKKAIRLLVHQIPFV